PRASRAVRGDRASRFGAVRRGRRRPDHLTYGNYYLFSLKRHGPAAPLGFSKWRPFAAQSKRAHAAARVVEFAAAQLDALERPTEFAAPMILHGFSHLPSVGT